MPNAVTSTSATIVARPLAALAGAGTADISTLSQISVSVEYDDLYEVTLSAADSTKLADAFTQSGAGSTFAMTLGVPANLEQVLVANLPNAVCSEWNSNKYPDVDSSGKNLSDAIADEMAYVFSLLTNNFPNILESAGSETNTIEWQDGAESMSGLLSAQECEILAQQLPEANYNTYKKGGDGADKEDPETHALQLTHGDSVIFVFNFTQALTTRGAPTKVAGSTSDDTATAPNDPAYGVATGDNVSYAQNSRKVAFKLTVAGGVGAVAGDKLVGLKA